MVMKKTVLSIAIVMLVLSVYIWAFPIGPPGRCPRTLTKEFHIGAASQGDDFPIWKTPQSIRITHIYGVLLSGTNVIGGLDEYDSNGANPVAVDSDITFNGGQDSDDGSLSNADIDAGDWVGWHTTGVDAPGYLTVTIYYRIKYNTAESWN
jgi:hypothetical protein